MQASYSFGVVFRGEAGVVSEVGAGKLGVAFLLDYTFLL